MTKAEVVQIAARNGMTLARHPITNEAWGYYLQTDNYVPELDALVDASTLPVAFEAFYGPAEYVTYRVHCPTTWFTLLD